MHNPQVEQTAFILRLERIKPILQLLDGVSSKGEYLCHFLIIYARIVENKAKYLLLVQMISRSVSRAAAAILPNCFLHTHQYPGFPKTLCPVLATQHVADQAPAMPVAQGPVAVAVINLIKPFVTVHGGDIRDILYST